jgi:hypothetical protein
MPRAYVMFAAPPGAFGGRMPASKAPPFLKRIWTFAQTHAGAIKSAAARSRRDAPRRSSRRAARSTLLRRQLRLQDSVQHRRLAGMKMLNALEALPSTRPAARLVREGLSI